MMLSNSATLEPPRYTVSLWAALFPVAVLIALLIINVVIYGDGATAGPNQIALLMAAAAAAVVGRTCRISIQTMMNGIVNSLGSALGAMLILLLIGSLAGTWLISGVVPAMIYYGLEILDPQVFLGVTVIICAIVSIATGSSWSTIATVGVALLAIGRALGVSEGLVGGAIISGAYFGDKISPLSDTTNLAAAMAGTELFTHIKYMLWTTVPSIVITMIIFFWIGFGAETQPVDQTNTLALSAAIDQKFYLTPILFVVPAVVLLMVILKIDAVVALFVGTILGGICAVVFQPAIVTEVANLPDVSVTRMVDGQEVTETEPASYLECSYVAVVNAMSVETSIDSEDEFARDLLSAGGMNGMLNTIWLIVTAMCFGGVMEACGLLQRITMPLVRLARTTGSLIATTVASCLFVNVTASDQYLAIVVPGRMFRKTYRQRKLAPQVLSRTLEDSGTVTSVLIPWNTCGATQAAILNVQTIVYAPYCFFNLISPLMTMLFGFFGIFIAKLRGDEPEELDLTGSDH